MADSENQYRSDLELAHTIKGAGQKLKCGRTTVYGLLGSGALEAKKIGRRTIITDASLRRCVASLPSWSAKSAALSDRCPELIAAKRADVAAQNTSNNPQN